MTLTTRVPLVTLVAPNDNVNLLQQPQLRKHRAVWWLLFASLYFRPKGSSSTPERVHLGVTFIEKGCIKKGLPAGGKLERWQRRQETGTARRTHTLREFAPTRHVLLRVSYYRATPFPVHR